MKEAEPDVVALFAQMYSELVAWRAASPHAILDEIAKQVTPRRQQVIEALIAELDLPRGERLRPGGPML
jgi:hypothetical protein